MKRSVITEHFHFYKQDQAADETIADFDVALRKLAVHCKFSDHLQETLHNHFVHGLGYITRPHSIACYLS